MVNPAAALCNLASMAHQAHQAAQCLVDQGPWQAELLQAPLALARPIEWDSHWYPM